MLGMPVRAIPYEFDRVKKKEGNCNSLGRREEYGPEMQ